ncbi:hypothetical protein [Desulfovermiculus halophilus]|nr:hypothetical protein [Desulfovermiculus halophilus]
MYESNDLLPGRKGGMMTSSGKGALPIKSMRSARAARIRDGLLA